MKRNLSRRQFLGYAGAAGSVVVLGACGRGGGGSSDTYRIGAVLELSGSDSAGGQLARRGYEFWAETVNGKGGISVGGKKYKVEVLVEDCKSEPASGADAATRLITQKNVEAMFGSYTSGVQLAMNPICQKYQVPVIAGSAESPAIWKAKPQFAYGVIPSVDLTADQAFKFIVEGVTDKPASAAIIGANEPFSKDAAAGFALGAKQEGLKVTENSLFPPTSDLTPILTRIKSQNPDILAVGGHDTVLIDVVKTAKSLNFAPKAIIMHYGVTEPAFAKELGADADGVLGLVDWTADSPYKDDVFGTAAEAAASFEKKHKESMDYTGAGCAVSGEVLQLALAELGKPPGLEKADRVKLNELIGKTDIETFYGPIKFDQSGDHFHANSAPPPILVQIQDGEVVAVEPEKDRKAKLQYPLAAWNKR